MSEPIYVFVISWERPLYLWSCLDSLFRETSSPARVVIIDNSSQDPLVPDVIRGFERRGLFHAVHRMPENRPDSFERILAQYENELGDRYVYMESDIIVRGEEGCWLGTMNRLFDQDPRLAMLGSRIDPSDFVKKERAELLAPELEAEQRENLIKLHSPERLEQSPVGAFTDAPFNPPGRLLMLRKAAVRQVGFQRDSKLHKALLAADYKTAIAYAVVHRHLSLLNFFDYPDYDYDSREKYFARAVEMKNV